MPLDELINEIEGEAERKQRTIRNEGKAEAEKIVGEARARAKELAQRSKEQADEHIERAKRQGRSSLEVEKKMLLLEAREEAIERELKGVMKSVESELRKNYMKKLLEGAVAEFSRNVPMNQIMLVTDKANAGLADRYGLKAETDSAVDGFVLRTADSSITLDSDIGRIVDAHADMIRNILAKRLFEKG